MAGEPEETGPRPSGAPGSGLSPVVRITGLVLGFALAIAATLAVFLTDDALYLRLAVIAVAWAFVIAAFAAGRRATDQAVAAGRENELRQAYALELEREVAARREYELKLENQLRRETQEAMRAELDQMRADLASVAQLRDQLAGLGELRADMGRLRHELTEQLSGEMLVERIVMRTQSIRMPAERPRLDPADPRLLEGRPAWDEELPRNCDLTASIPPVVEPRPDQQPVDDRPRRTGPPPVPAPVDRPLEFTQALPRVSEPAARHAPPSPREWLEDRPTGAIPATGPFPAPDLEPTPRTGPEWSPAPSRGPSTGSHAALWDAPAAVARTSDDGALEPPRRHRRAAPDEEVVAVPREPEHEPDVDETAGHQRLTQILAESGATAGGGGRRRRRAADEDPDGDDVLARVLGRG